MYYVIMLMQISWLNSYADQPVKTGDKTLGARVVPKKHWDQNCCERLRNCKLYYLSHFLLFGVCTCVNIEMRSRFLFWDLHTWNCVGKYKKRWNILENWQALSGIVSGSPAIEPHRVRACRLPPGSTATEPGRVSL
jgi:hypothetical protein